jgi:uncharacterized protein YdeI (YjbR/CyaY-like superfamily)
MDKINSWTKELEILKDIIVQTGLEETTKWGSPVFTFGKKNVVSIHGFKNFFAIWFFKGSQLNDFESKLINAQEGTTKLMRQWRFTSKDQIDKDLIIKYIKEAIEIEVSTKAKP